jgi:hypothetical protein
LKSECTLLPVTYLMPYAVRADVVFSSVTGSRENCPMATKKSTYNSDIIMHSFSLTTGLHS